MEKKELLYEGKAKKGLYNRESGCFNRGLQR